MNLLLVDDEVIIVSLLKKHIAWKELGIEEVLIAYTAAEARRSVEDHAVDIIICDIEMPGESGLDFLFWVRENRPEIMRIILTGYPDFKYAQDAISIGVLKYLLKPVSFEELSETVKYAVGELKKRKADRCQQSLTPQGEYDKKREEKIFYTKMITDDILPFPEFIDRAVEEGRLERKELEPEGLVYIRLGRTVNGKNDSALLYALGNIAEELFENIMEIHLWDNIFWVIRTKEDKEHLHEMCELFISKLQGRLQGEISAYFICHVSLETLSESAKDLRRTAMQYRNVGQNIYNVDHLIEALMDGPEAGAGNLSSWSVVQSVKEYLHEHYMEPIGRQEIEEAVHLNGDYLNRIFKSATGYSLIQYIQYYRILVARRLIAEEKCTITEVGTSVGFDTPSYFTKVFKKWTNITPLEYYNRLHND